ncbi:MAG: hypothetical protein IKE15_04085 [Clostridia bacterium]|nr:hypothetical protein [Clostridia bacterium]
MELSGYLSLFPGASREKPRFMALAEAVLRQAADLIPLVRSMQSAYSFSQAEGIQLDAIAEAAGLKREPGMADEAFRRYLLAKLKLWTWDGTNEGVPEALPEGVTLSDNGDGTVSVSPAGTNPDLLPVPAGVQTVTE